MTSEAGPALPWGNNGNGSDPNDNVVRDVPATLGMALGSAKIEVPWQIVADEENPEIGYIKWKGATLQRREESAKDGEGRICYVLLLDADDSSGDSEPTEHVVTFLDDHELWLMMEQEFVTWRMEGQDWQPPDVEDDDVGDDIEKVERILGMNVQDAWRANFLQQASHLPPDLQRELALGLDRRIEIFKEELEIETERMQAEHATVVDAKAVEDILKRMQRRLKDEDDERK